MINMTFDSYAELDDKIASLPPRVENYGLEEKDLEKMEADPKRYYKYAMYLLNQPYYETYSKFHKFDNEDAIPQDEVIDRLNNLIKNFIQLTE